MHKRVLFTKNFWLDASERAIATFAQVVLSVVTVMVPVATISDGASLSVAVEVAFAAMPLIILTGLGGAVFSVLKSIAAAYAAGTDTASFVDK